MTASGEPQTTPAPSTGRIKSLDGWRAISIALVLVSHEVYTSGVPSLPSAWAPLFDQGNLGVRIFFVISGYLITHLMLREVVLTGEFSISRFYIRRALRILPVYFLFLIVLLGMQALGLFHDTMSSWLGALTFTRNMFGNGQSPTVHLWSLSIEEQFYLLWPVAFSMLELFRRRKLAVLMLCAVVAVSVGARIIPCSEVGLICERLLNERSALKFADCLAIGCLGALVVARIERNGGVFKEGTVSLFGIAAACALGLSAWLIMPQSLLAWSLLVTVQAFLTMIAIYATTRGGWLSRPLNAAPVVAIGVASYSLYIWHFIFISHFLPGLGNLIVDAWWFWWVPAVVVALASYHLFERRFLALRRKNRPVSLSEN